MPQGFGAALRQARLLAGLSQEALAERAGISADAVAALERGRRRAPRASTVAALATALDLSPADRARLVASADPGAAAEAGGTAPGSSEPAAPPRPPLVGRDGELAELAALLHPAGPYRMVTLVGPGGVGKTALARAFAAGAAERYPDGVVLVDLSTQTHAAWAVEAFARGMRVPLDPRDRVGSLTGALATVRALVVLDCVERVRGGLRPVLEAVLDGTRDLALLATSRVPLQVEGEERLAVVPLPSPEPERGPVNLRRIAANPSVQLLLNGIRRHDPRFAMTPQNAPALAAVCTRLEGLPLALELAAARVPAITLPELVTRAGRRIDLLEDGPADLPERHRSLRATLEWSADLLSDAERHVFAVAGVFAGAATGDALESVCSAAGEVPGGVPAAITGLVDAGMLGLSGGRPERYTMLDTVREYALELLAARPGAEQVPRRHAGYFLALAEGALALLRRGEQASALATVTSEEPNLRAALDWACQTEPLMAARLVTELWPFWYIQGQLSEGRRQLERVLDVWTSPDDHRGHVLRGSAVLALLQGDVIDADRYAQANLVLQRSLGRGLELADALITAGNVAREAGRYDAARTLYEEALVSCRERGHMLQTSVTLNNLGTLARVQRQVEEAKRLHTESLDLRWRSGDTVGVAYCLEQLAHDARMAGDLDAALAHARESLALTQSLNARPGSARSQNLLASLTRGRGGYREAAELASQALASGVVLEDHQVIAIALGNLAGIAADTGDHRLAARMLGAAATAARRGNTPVPEDDAAAQAADEARVRAALGERAFAEAARDGATVSPVDFLDTPPA